jgi:hypothetical protein
MPTTFTKIASVTVGAGGAANISFTSIPSTFTDLCIKISARTTQTGAIRNTSDLALTFNSSTTGYSSKLLSGNPAIDNPPVSASNSGTSIVWGGMVSNADATANTFGSVDIYIPNYAVSNNKSVNVEAVGENNSSNAGTEYTAGLWSNTAAITSIASTPGAGNFVQYTTATLYGIKNS